ncbi:Fic family protein [Candidatus Dependentiae bacterium]|nr:Fic family protein [Candidatus Dependentiae bacterium]
MIRILTFKNFVLGAFLLSSTFLPQTYSENPSKGEIKRALRDFKKELREKFERQNQQYAWSYASMLTTKDRKNITLQDLLHTHYLILRNIDNVNAGRLRTMNVKLLSQPHIKFPNYHDVPAQVNNFFNWLHAVEGDPVTIAIRAFCKLVLEIHPFADGNGRTSRLLMNVLLVQAGYQPVNFHKKTNPHEYYKIYIPALNKVLFYKDYTEFDALIRSRLKKRTRATQNNEQLLEYF